MRLFIYFQALTVCGSKYVCSWKQNALKMGHKYIVSFLKQLITNHFLKQLGTLFFSERYSN